MPENNSRQLLEFLRRPWITKLINGVSFYIVWFAALGFAARCDPWPGILSAVILLAFHFVLTQHWRLDLIMMGILSVFGIIVDSLYIHLNVIVFTCPGPFFEWLAPLWVIVLYAYFATTLNCSLSYLGAHPVGLSIVGALGGPLCYYAGVKLGAASLGMGIPDSLIIVAAVWCFGMPVIAYINGKLRRRYQVLD